MFTGMILIGLEKRVGALVMWRQSWEATSGPSRYSLVSSLQSWHVTVCTRTCHICQHVP